MNLNYDIATITSKEDLNFFEEMLPYVSEHILSYQLKINNVEINYSDENHKEQILSKLDILKELATKEVVVDANKAKTKVLLNRTNVKCSNNKPIFENLKKDGSLYEFGSGTFAYSGLFLKIIDYFYIKTRELSQINFKAIEYKFPVLFPIESFKQGGYFETFPHHIMFQSTIKQNIDVLNKFSKEGFGENDELLKNMNISKSVLKNAACGPLYPMLSNKIINKDKMAVYFTVGKCFRNESLNVFELARLNEFTMSEIIFVGTDKQIREGMEKAKKLWLFWIEIFNLNCLIETANDSFFASNYKKLKFFQKIGDSKIEFRLLLPHYDKYIACSSANYHRTHFTKRYNIKNEDGFCHTACIAFGIERLVYAFFCQHGCDPKKWDKKVFDEIEKYTSNGKK